MYLLYVDESGEPANENEEYFVLGGVSIYENNAYFLSEELDKVQQKWFPSQANPIEFHASKIRNRNEEPWRSMKQEQCREVLLDICKVINSQSMEALTLFGVAVHKKLSHGDSPVEKAFHELCGHFDAFIARKNVTSERAKNRGLLILDSPKYKGHLDTLLLEYRKTGGTSFGRVKNFADAPVFANSQTTRLIQVADLVAYSIYRRYEKSDTLLLDTLIGRFDRDGGVIHGLTHLVPNYRTCACPACLSRQ